MSAKSLQRPRPPRAGDVEAYRSYYREYLRPRRYFPAAHVTAHVASVLAGTSFALFQLRHVRPLEWLGIPSAFVLSSFFVYWFHRFVLHRSRAWFRFAYVKHTLEHHRFFTYERITRDEKNDLHIMLFPWQTGAPLIVGTYVLAIGLSPVVGHNVAFMIMFVGVLYFGLYELVHTIAHLPDGHVLTRMPGLAFLREHHRIHHDPALMGRYNFNVVLPLFDWLYGAMLTARPPATRQREAAHDAS